MFRGNEGHSSSSIVFSRVGRDDKSERAGESRGHAGLKSSVSIAFLRGYSEFRNRSPK